MAMLPGCNNDPNTQANTIKNIVGTWETDEALGLFNCYTLSTPQNIFWAYDENGNQVFAESITDLTCPNMGNKLTFTDKGDFTMIKTGIETTGLYEFENGILTLKTPITISSNSLYSAEIIFLDKDTILFRDAEQAPNYLNSKYMYSKYTRQGSESSMKNIIPSNDLLSSSTNNTAEDILLDFEYTTVLTSDLEEELGSYISYIDEDEVVVIIKYKGQSEKVVIPDKIENKRVAIIGWETFQNCENVTDVTIPDSVLAIGGGAFARCTKLINLKIGNGVIRLFRNTFYGCTNLTSITIPSIATYIDDDAFIGCENFTIICSEGSYAHNYAIDNRIDFKLK